MEYTKDVIFNIQYKDNIGAIRLKKEGFKNRIFKVLKTNKFITVILTSLVILIAIDIVLVNTFMSLLTTF